MVALSCALGGAQATDAQELALAPDPYADLETRPQWPKVLDLQPPRDEHRLVVKFADAARVRLAAGRPVSTRGVDLTPVDDLARLKNVPIDYRPLVDLPDDAIERVERAAAANTGVRPIDLRGMFIVDAPADRLAEIGEALVRIDAVDWAEFELLRPEPPVCADLPPFSGDLSGAQGYTAFYDGFNIDGARNHAFFTRGAGVNIADIEYGVNGDHEDLCNIIFEHGQTIPSWVYTNGWDSHGTAVMGVMVAGDNGYGVTGLAPDAQPYFFPENSAQQGSRRAAAITSAAATLDAGDIIVLEMQTILYGGNYGPAELSSSVWSAVKNAVDAGRVVVAAAGNGNQNLDSPAYAPYKDRGDSGAIIVGAGINGGNPFKLSYSTHGQRVNLQGWGQGVVSTGYGGFVTYGGDKNQRYTSTFGGTSAATPCVAGVAAVLQGYARQTHEKTLTSREIRQILIDTGIPQSGGGGHIGPRPDARAALHAVDEMFGAFCDADFTHDGVVDLSDFGVFGAAFGSTPDHPAWDPRCDFDNDGDVDLSDFGVFGSRFGMTSEQCRDL